MLDLPLSCPSEGPRLRRMRQIAVARRRFNYYKYHVRPLYWNAGCIHVVDRAWIMDPPEMDTVIMGMIHSSEESPIFGGFRSNSHGNEINFLRLSRGCTANLFTSLLHSRFLGFEGKIRAQGK